MTEPKTKDSHLSVNVWRGGNEGELVNYQVPARENQTVLDVITEIQRFQQPVLRVRVWGQESVRVCAFSLQLLSFVASAVRVK